MTPFTITLDRNQLFLNVCQLTLHVTDNLCDTDGVSQVDRYRISEGDRELYDTLDEDALYDLYDRCQILFKDVDSPLTISKESFAIKGNLPSNLPVNMVATAMDKALANLLMAKWFNIRGAVDLQQKYESAAEISLTTVKSRILSRNTQNIPYRAY